MMCAATGDAEFKSMEVRQLADWVEAEAQRFTNAATVCLGRIVELAGQASIQMLTDAGWFKDRKKYLSMSFQAVEEDWSGNLVIRIDFANFVDGTAEANVDMIKAALDAFGATAAVIGATAQDMAAKKVAVLMDKETAHCGLHQNDKLMKIACGDLDKKKGGKVSNSFLSFLPTKQRASALGKFFRFRGKREVALQLAGKTAKVRVYSVKVPSSGIRVAAFQQFVLSLIMNRPAFAMVYQFLEADQMQGKASHKGTLSDLDWKIVCQVEAVMSTARIGVIASQNEHSMLFAYTPMIRKLLMKLLRKGDLRVVDTRSLNNDPNKVAFNARLSDALTWTQSQLSRSTGRQWRASFVVAQASSMARSSSSQRRSSQCFATSKPPERR